MKRRLIFFQIVLCMLLFAFCVIIRTHSRGEAVTAGTFEKPHMRNLTFEDYIHNSYGDLF